MHKKLLLQNFLQNSFDFMHKKRQKVIFSAVDALMNGASLSLSSLGRHIDGNAKERNQIRKMDRLLGNKHLHQEKQKIYKAINELVLSTNQPIICVDWSCLSYMHGRYLLRASLAVKGRSLVCYQEVHPQEHENNTDAHNQFLDNLKLVLPDDISPIIVTDAIFSGLWFKKVKSFGWDFVGRIRRNRGCYYSEKDANWVDVDAGFKEATNKPLSLGNILLTKRNKLPCELIVYKKAPKGRKKMNRKGSIEKGTYTRVNAKSAREPWLLVTSLSDVSPVDVVNYYSKRMQIEEEFRDTKSRRYGFGLSESRSTIHARVEVLLIINLLASLYCWLLACETVMKKQHVDYHANSIKTNTILSAISLGRSVYRKIKQISIQNIRQALCMLVDLISGGLDYANC